MSEEVPRLSSRKKLAFSGCLLLLLLLATEAGWRVYATGKYRETVADLEQSFFMEHPTLGQIYRRGRWTYPVPGADSMVFHINDEHLRGGPLLDPKPADVLRILCLGGSTTFSTGCKADSLSYPAQLQAMLHARFPGQRFEVLNAGVPGFRSAESYHNLRRLAGLKPDLVLVYHGINEVCWGFPEPFYLDPAHNPRPPSRTERRKIEAESFFFTALLQRMFAPRLKNEEGRTAVDDRVIEAFGNNLTAIFELARELGAQPVSITFGARLRGDFPEEVRLAIEKEKAFRLAHISYEGLVDGMARVNARNREVAATAGVPLVELEGKLPVEPENWMDFVHLNERGTPRMVSLVCDGIEAIVRQKIEERP